MDSSAGSRSIIPPARAQLALALAIVKHKPEDTEVKGAWGRTVTYTYRWIMIFMITEYIFKIRNFIKSSKKLGMSCPEKFFDSVLFWKSAYEKSEAEHAQLLNTLYDLEQRNSSLLAKTRLNNSWGATAISSPNKRKHTGVLEEIGPSKLNSKRARSSLTKKSFCKNPETEQQGVELTHEEERSMYFATPTVSQLLILQATSLMRQIYNMQRALQRRQNGKDLANNAVILCKEAEHSVLDIIQREVRSQFLHIDTEISMMVKPNTSTVLQAVELAFNLAYRALHKICNTSTRDKSDQGKSQITYYIVCLFESITIALTQYCTAMSKSQIEIEKSSQIRKSTKIQAKRPKADKRARKATRGDDSAIKEEGIVQELTDLLCNMAMLLDPVKEEDRKVMEGFLFVVLDRVGKMLALYVFNDTQPPYENCPTLKLPNGLESMRQEDLSMNIGQCEAGYLIKLLKVFFADERSSTTQMSVTRTQFISGMRNKLQKTLLQAVFGIDEPLFQEGLKRPATPPPQDCDSEMHDKIAFSEWFTQELWMLVGWDMLA